MIRMLLMMTRLLTIGYLLSFPLTVHATQHIMKFLHTKLLQSLLECLLCRKDPAKTIARSTMMSASPTVTRQYAQPYPTGDQIWERGKNISAVTDGETFSDLWMDDLVYATTIHASHHLRANGNLDGYVVFGVLVSQRY